MLPLKLTDAHIPTYTEEPDYWDNMLSHYNESTIRSLYPVIGNELYHRCDISNYWQIQRDGFIKPNDGSRPYTYPQSATNYGVENQWVCLFDFQRVTYKQLLLTHRHWSKFFNDCRPVTVIFELDREFLPLLIPNKTVPKVGDEGYKNHIYYVESWYPKPIPLSLTKRYIVTCSKGYNVPVSYKIFNYDEREQFERILTQSKRSYS